MDAEIARLREDVARRARAALAGGPAALAALLAGVDAEVARSLARARGPDEPRAACRAGCAACCTVHVATLPAEGAAAAAFLRARLPAPRAASLAAELVAFHERVRWLEERERIALGLACPLLDAGGACRIHAARPLACRSVSSLDADDCRRAMDARAADEEEAPVRMHVLQQALYLAALGALGDAFDAAGLDARTRDVSGMVGAFLGDEALARAWLGGARVPLE